MRRSWPRCGVREAACLCQRQRWHRGPHECACGGSWTFKRGVFEVVAWPPWPEKTLIHPPASSYDVVDGVPVIREPQQGRMIES